MASDLVKLFDSFCEAIAKKDLNKMLSLFNEDATYTVYAQPYKPVSSKAALKPFMEDEFRKVDEYKVTKLFICENKGNLVVEWLVNYRDHNTGKRSEVQGISILEAKKGKIQTWKEYFRQ
jgi:ketosteroid isomerase-like protein